MKAAMTRLETVNRDLAKKFHSLVAVSQEQAESLQQSCNRDFSEVLQWLKEDDVKAHKLQGILKDALQSLTHLTTSLSMPDDAAQPSGEDLFNTFMVFPRNDVGTSLGYGSNQGGL